MYFLKKLVHMNELDATLATVPADTEVVQLVDAGTNYWHILMRKKQDAGTYEAARFSQGPVEAPKRSRGKGASKK